MFSVTTVQKVTNLWTTKKIRVQFDDKSLEKYNGCYTRAISKGQRHDYESDGNAIFTYCPNEKVWSLRSTTENRTDPCGSDDDDNDDKNMIAQSKTTMSLDVSSEFEYEWFTATGIPIDMYFFDANGIGDTFGEDICTSFLGNGVCDASFNNQGYLFDKGDCCALTCNNRNCGKNDALSVFGSNETNWVGYPNCEKEANEHNVAITIVVNKVSSSRDPERMNVTKEMEEKYFDEIGKEYRSESPMRPQFDMKCDNKTVLSVQIDQTMEGKNATIVVWDGADCIVYVRNNTGDEMDIWDNIPIWYVDYTIYKGQDNRFTPIVTENSRDHNLADFFITPKCYSKKLEEAGADISNISPNALKTIALRSSCDDDFLVEKLALYDLNSAAIFKPKSFLKQQSEWTKWEQPQCWWDVLGCNNEGSVEQLLVEKKDLIGTISTSIGLLTSLRNIQYDRNGLTGMIPTEFGLLTNLERLDIDNNNLTGTIPTELGLLTNLIEFDIDHNDLTSTIPSELGELKQMRYFELSSNKLSGSIPSSIYNLAALVRLELSKNLMNGTISSEIGLMKNLKRLELAENMLRGTLPSEFGELTKLKELALSGNKFVGLLPTEIGLLTSLEVLLLQNNTFTGQIPSEIGQLTKLKNMRLENNQFTGTIPTEITTIKGLMGLTYDSLTVSADIPDRIRTMTYCNDLCDGYEVKEGEADKQILEETGTSDLTCSELRDIEMDPDEFVTVEICNALKECTTCPTGLTGFDLLPAWIVNPIP